MPVCAGRVGTAVVFWHKYDIQFPVCVYFTSNNSMPVCAGRVGTAVVFWHEYDIQFPSVCLFYKQ